MSAPAVAIVHYHLRGGGVTRVVDHALRALADRDGAACVIVGEAPPDGAPGGDAVRVLPALAYETTPADHDPETVADNLRREAREALGRDPDLWHIHNHGLGKNAVLAPAVRVLAERGERMLLQPHDFAEDGRPDRYAFLADHLAGGDAERVGALLYPAAPHVHYGTLNRRDLDFLRDAGADAATLHHLPNAVDYGMAEAADAADAGDAAAGGRLFLYPTRAIRRKNVGEFLLWAAAAEAGDRYAVTLAPKNPSARPVYDRWVAFAAEERLPVQFGAGLQPGVDFGALVRSAHAIVTTSVGEGFGLAFLEPWLAERPLAGRALPEVTDEFADAGVDLDGLYRRLEVPLAWVGGEAFTDRLAAGLERSLTAYGRPCEAAAVDRARAAATDGTWIDFGRLDEALQEPVIRRLRADADAAAALRPAALAETGAATIRANRDAVRQTYSLDAYAGTLTAAYEAVAASATGPVDALDGAALLDRFLDPARFALLRA